MTLRDSIALSWMERHGYARVRWGLSGDPALKVQIEAAYAFADEYLSCIPQLVYAGPAEILPAKVSTGKKK